MNALSQTATQIGLNSSFYTLFALIVCLHFVLSFVYLKPYQRLLLKRKQKTEGASRDAEMLVLRANEQGAKYKELLKHTNESIRGILKEAEDQGKKEESRLVGDASLKGKTLLQKAQKDSEQERTRALESVSEEISGIATSIATKVLGRSIGTR